jgi:hypothetical protein
MPSSASAGTLPLSSGLARRPSSVDEAALRFVACFSELTVPKRSSQARVSARDRQRAISAAHVIEAHPTDNVTL